LHGVRSWASFASPSCRSGRSVRDDYSVFVGGPASGGGGEGNAQTPRVRACVRAYVRAGVGCAEEAVDGAVDEGDKWALITLLLAAPAAQSQPGQQTEPEPERDAAEAARWAAEEAVRVRVWP
jgi:hypothetical protein